MTERFIPSHSVSINQFSAKVMDQLILLTQHGKGYRAPSRSITLSIVEARVLRAWLDKVTPHDAEQEQRAAQLFEEGPALETSVTRCTCSDFPGADEFCLAHRVTTGHGHVRRRSDGVKARCGGPAMCKECAIEQAALNR